LNLTQSDKNSGQARKAVFENDLALSQKEKKKSTNKTEKLDVPSNKIVKKKANTTAVSN